MSYPFEENYLKVLRWMRENINLASSIYRTKSMVLSIDQAIMLDSQGNPIRRPSPPPKDLDKWLHNSVAGLVCCCYMDALGKVGQNGKRAYALNSFAQAHMPDLIAECNAKGGNYSLNNLYIIYRCGFAHQFASSKAIWDRLGRDKEYWFPGTNNRPGLNIDRLADGVLAGIDRFESWFNGQVAVGTASYEKFFDWIDS